MNAGRQRLGSLLAGMVAGAALAAGAHTLRRSPEPPPAPSPPAAPMSGAVPSVSPPALAASPDCPDEQPLIDEIAALQRELGAVRLAASVAEGQLETEIGAPLDWPADTPDAYRESAIEAHLSGLVGRVEGAHLVGMDCAEYPCIGVVAFAGADPNAAYDAFNALHDQTAYANSWGTVSAYGGDEGTELMVRFIGFPVRSVDDPDRFREANKRQQYRYDQLSRAYEPDLKALRAAK